ncbi:MAG: hypothetical protein A2X49_01790 [Lentisphaerae bacterium GWF2_52_8]|nr:MAG: hypothetical protein A2X49_01790 [Lentisphaerae bacterium GWF2_52_8]
MSTREDITSFLKESGAPLPFHVQMAGISYCDGSYRISRCKSPIFVFEYVMEGRGTLVVNSVEYHPVKGDVYIAPKDSTHHYFSDAKDPWTKIWFNVEGELVEQLIRAYGLLGVHHVPACPLYPVFEEGLRCARENPVSAHEKIALIIHRIIQELSAVLKSRGRPELRSPFALEMKQFLDTKVSGNVSIKNLAAHVHRSPSQAMRIFKSEWGLSPVQYLLERKFEMARALLSESALTVKEISASLGFKDEYYFAALFKRKNGIAPGRYRQARRS